MDLPKAYIPKEYEDKIYKKWEDSGYCNPDNLETRGQARSFTISMPPPNATGVLHVGHTLGITIQDIMARYRRMRGDKTLLLPGTDHAAIATQNVVEKMLKKEGTSRHKLGREKFLELTKNYVEKNKSTINNQTRKMGASCDWSREAYTLSDKLSRVVSMQFKQMYDDGLIYQGTRIVNWCPRCCSTLADDEVEYKEQSAKLYTFKYSNVFPLAIATTRPETKLGDTAVAVNPNDKRYQKYIGKTYQVDFVGVPLKLKVIAENEINPEFGTGAVGVTPAHSFADSLMAEKNNLEVKKVIGQDGKILAGFGKYSNLKTKEAREKIIEKLKSDGLLENQADIKNNLSICYRCHTEIEPLPSLQWFVAMNKEFALKNPALIKKYGKKETTLKEISLWAVKSGEIKIIPEYFAKTYFHWMENLRDWCISRQLWFGHRIPAWYKNNEIYVGSDKPKNSGWVQDEDTLDTWFSSALWTWSTLLERKNFEKFNDLKEWVKNSPDIKNFHPTSVMETMHDILFFWVARMIIMTLYSLNEVPFKTVYLHGMVCDEHGKKMSKSRPETCIEPIEMSQKYGTDALRLSMVLSNAAGNSTRLSEQKIAGFRNFANKLWNIGRFIQLSTNNKQLTTNDKLTTDSCESSVVSCKTLADKWITSRINNLIKEVTDDLENFRFGLAGEKLYDFTWHELADWYVEIAKIPPYGGSAEVGQNSYKILIFIYKTLLKLVHPFAPFVTEKIWEYFGNGDLLIIEKWPQTDEKKITGQAEQDFELIKELITAIRSWRKENKKEPKEILKIQIAAPDKLVGSQKEIIDKLAKVDLEIVEKLVDKDLEIGNLKIKF
ncbi:valine--tRNA ligase [Candidatus Kuenenbacteria bacterium RIFCSPHIGHO2_02_FULL_39_13]|uniref:Valine--tRNA ligase n=1 Tax=Candidatus Kuenenbacteria bacterium RIFCSPHIGHO2_02_FULL_39_13 TaxID=1798561 RepID=A0A1F6FNG6_9BACT|nr:MAG: valine--tRNA ligase [Candidatus Kuenenbacteria bacterium RIFCSPHIGHO2_02_FULL_39_13]